MNETELADLRFYHTQMLNFMVDMEHAINTCAIPGCEFDIQQHFHTMLAHFEIDGLYQQHFEEKVRKHEAEIEAMA